MFIPRHRGSLPLNAVAHEKDFISIDSPDTKYSFFLNVISAAAGEERLRRRRLDNGGREDRFIKGSIKKIESE